MPIVSSRRLLLFFLETEYNDRIPGIHTKISHRNSNMTAKEYLFDKGRYQLTIIFNDIYFSLENQVNLKPLIKTH